MNRINTSNSQMPIQILLAGGKSNNSIYDMIIRNIGINDIHKTIIDLGSGIGNLINILKEKKIGSKLIGIDYLDRPEHMDSDIEWYSMDFNEEISINLKSDIVICSEVIEHVENPRHLVRQIKKLLNPEGIVILTTPNQHSIRSYLTLLFTGHFAAFRGTSYPAHITALLQTDLVHIFNELDMDVVGFDFDNNGSVPGFPRFKWSDISFGLLRGRMFSDSILIKCANTKG